MSNRIVQVQVRDHSLDPAQAELRIAVVAEHVGPTTELRGRLMGPRCLYAATVEVAYPLRPLVRRPEDKETLAARVVIPEPSLWEPECPFLYQGTVELWEDGRRCDQVPLRRGLRRVLLGPAGLRVNGRALSLHGRTEMGWDENRAAALRRDGCNVLIGAPEAPAVWDLADAQGFFVLGGLKHLDESSLARATGLLDHPSCFGWLLQMPVTSWDRETIRRLRGSGGARIGVQLTEPPPELLPEWVDFIACPAENAADLRVLGRPLLLFGGGSDAPGVFGRVE